MNRLFFLLKLKEIILSIKIYIQANYITLHLYKRIMSLNTPYCELCKVQP